MPVTGSLARASRYFAGVARARENTQTDRVARQEAAAAGQTNCLHPGASHERLLAAYDRALQTPGGGPLERRLAPILRPLASDGSTVGAKLMLVDSLSAALQRGHDTAMTDSHYAHPQPHTARVLLRDAHPRDHSLLLENAVRTGNAKTVQLLLYDKPNAIRPDDATMLAAVGRPECMAALLTHPAAPVNNALLTAVVDRIAKGGSLRTLALLANDGRGAVCRKWRWTGGNATPLVEALNKIDDPDLWQEVAIQLVLAADSHFSGELVYAMLPGEFNPMYWRLRSLGPVGTTHGGCRSMARTWAHHAAQLEDADVTRSIADDAGVTRSIADDFSHVWDNDADYQSQ